MTTPTAITLVVLAMQFILFTVGIIYFAWKVPTKDDLTRLERKLDDLNNHFIDHLKNHPHSSDR